MKMAKQIALFVLLTALSAQADVIQYLDVDDVRYEGVKFGPVNQGKVTLFHSHGVTTVPVGSLPQEYQQQLGVKPPAALPLPAEVPKPKATAGDPNATLQAMRQRPAGGASGDWATYNRERGAKVVLDGKLVDKETLTPLTGFLVKERASLDDGKQKYSGAAFDLAERKADVGKVATAMELRPALWKRTDERVFLLNYQPVTLVGALMRVYAIEVDPIAEWRTFKVGTEPTFEEWKRLAGR